MWDKILGSVDDYSVTAFAYVSKQLRRVQQTSGRRLKTDLQQYEDDNNIYYSFCLYETRKFSAVSETWCLWSMSSLTVKLVWENVKRSSIMLAAAFWGHLDALKQWKEQSGKQKGLFFEKNIGYFAASGSLGSPQICTRERIALE